MRCVGLVVLALAIFLSSAYADGGEGKDSKFKQRTLPQAKVSNFEIWQYPLKPENQPQLDFKPSGKQPQPSSAGASAIKTDSQIIGGTAAVPKQFPWQVYMHVDASWLCGGSLIAANWVLTAAHCVDGATTFVITAGGIDRLGTETGEKTQTSKVAIKHENYDDYYLVNDIAVVQLPQNFVLNEYINVIRLPKQTDAKKSFASKAVTVSGYGMTANTGPASKKMNFVSLNVTTNAACASYYGTTTVTSSCLCTAGNPKKSTCSGDSGGPLVIKDTDGKFTQVGVVSFGASSSCTKYPSGFARVTSFLGWISEKTGIKINP